MSTTLATGLSDIMGQDMTSAASTSTTGTGSLGTMDSFLKLFLTQLQNQDPTNPLQSYELSAQLASFSTVEQLSNANTTLKGIESYAAANNNATMTGMVGKTATVSNSAIQVTSGTAGSAAYTLGTDAASVTIEVYNSSGTLVRTISDGAQTAGSHTVTWDGKNDSGNTVDDGLYTYNITATNSSGSDITASTNTQSKIYAFKMYEGSPYFILDNADGVVVPVSSVTNITD